MRVSPSPAFHEEQQPRVRQGKRQDDTWSQGGCPKMANTQEIQAFRPLQSHLCQSFQGGLRRVSGRSLFADGQTGAPQLQAYETGRGRLHESGVTKLTLLCIGRQTGKT